MNDLVLFDEKKINAVAVFADKDSIDPVLRAIEEQVITHVPDLTTAKGRDFIKSLAHKVAKSKVALDDLGKKLVEDEKKRLSLVDISRKHARDFLDELKDRVRKPLTDWEFEQERIEEEKRLAECARLDAERIEAERIKNEELARMNAEIASLRKEKEERELAERVAEEARIEKERAEQAERDRIANEDRIRKEGEEKAKREAEALIQREREASALRELQAKKAAEDAEKARLKAIEDARIAQEKAVKAERERIEKIERDRLAKEAAEKAAAEKKAANEKHRKGINNSILADLVKIGISDDQAKAIITAVAKGEIKFIQINY